MRMQTSMTGMVLDPRQQLPMFAVSVKQPGLVIATADIHLAQQ
jgi:hypothetical protein